MAKSKGKTKSSRSTAQSPLAPKQLNPFYIEPAPPAQSSTWEGDYDWNNGDGEEEQAGLLVTQNRWNIEEGEGEGEEQSYPRPRYLRETTTRGSEWKTRACILFSVLTFIFWLLLSAFSGDHLSSSTEHVVQTQGTPISSKNESAPQLVPPAQDDDVDAHKKPIESDNHDDVISNEAAGDDDVDESLITTSGIDEPAVDDDGTSYNSGNETRAMIHVVVLGERHSGVEWLLDTLKSCYDPDSITVTSGLTREAYWFQDAEGTHGDASTTTFVVLAMVRDPYDWLQAMWLHPLYAPTHYSNGSEPLSLRDFSSKEWSLIEATTTEQQNNTNTSSYYCQLGFAPTQVVPCLQIDDSILVLGTNKTTIPIYELDPATGRAFDNIMALRAAKLKHWFDTIPVEWNLLDGGGVMAINYETGLTDSIWNELNARIGAEATCSSTSSTGMLPPPLAKVHDKATAKQLTSRKFLKWMLVNVDWQLEARFGYSPRPAGTQRVLVAP